MWKTRGSSSETESEGEEIMSENSKNSSEEIADTVPSDQGMRRGR